MPDTLISVTPMPDAPSPAAAVQPLRWVGAALQVLDQRQLPHQCVYVSATSSVEVAQLIRGMAVRGAPAIGIAAAYGVALAVMGGEDMAQAFEQLQASRPTAINLHWALARMQGLHSGGADAGQLLAEAQAIHAEDAAMNQVMGRLGAQLLGDAARVLTHCNTGALATGGHGTALGVIRSAHAAGQLAAVYAGETRPWLQGSRLTAWELQQEGIAAELIADSAAASLMAAGKLDWVIVGADRIVANGDVANKIGTYALAVLAHYHKVKFMVVAPWSSVDMTLQSGADIPIEFRAADELTQLAGQPIAPAGQAAWNPVFDVTPAALIDALVTERGVVHAPTRQAMERLMRKA